ncbi:hypothetical protein Q7P35_006714 [Cladosporium inversicolor]
MARESDNAGPTLLAIAIVVLILVLTTTALRITVRAKRHALGGDDYTIAAASLLTIGRVTCQIISVQHGNGRHREFLSVEDYQYVNFLTWLTQLFLFPILCLLKISVCLLVLRIKSTKRLRYALWSLIVLLVLTTLLPDIVLLAECDPVSAYWTSQHDKCWTPNVRIYSIYLQTSVSVFADVVCTLLPIAVVWNLTLSLKNKIAVCALMSLGVVSTAFACVRASSLGLAVSDLSWVYCWAAIWGNIELGFGILGANLALSRTYYDFFKRGLNNLTSKTRSTSAYPRYPEPDASNNPSNSHALHSLPISKKSKSSRNRNDSNPLSSTTLTHNSSASPTWDGSHKNKSSHVQIHGRRSSSGARSDDSDEIPLKGGRGDREMERDAIGGGIERKIEFSVEEDARSGIGEAGWGRDLEREGSRGGEGREVGVGRGI